MTEKKVKITHIIMLILGTAFLASGAFHSGIWFDESYTVGLMQQNIPDLSYAATFDVHPLFYYIVLRLFAYIFGNGIMVLRLFSVLCAALLALVGYTHIRRDFGYKTGFWFSFFVFFTPSTFKYALQIRMYTLAPLLVVLTAIYAYRLVMDEDKKTKNAVFFVSLSLMSAYTHYYGLIAVAIINILLLVYYNKNKISLKKWYIMAAIQIGAYIPGAVIFIIQISLGGANWIKIKWETLFDSISFHFLGVPLADVDVLSVIYIVTMCFSIFMYAVFAYILMKKKKKNNEDIRPAAYGFIVYFGVILVYMTVSIVRPVYYVRYTMISYGMLLFAFAYLLARSNSTKLKIVIVVFLLGLSAARAVPIYEENYSAKNSAIDDYLAANLQEGDIFLSDSAGAFAITVKYQNVPMYFYNIWGWNVDKAYMAFGPNVKSIRNIEDLKDYKGRIWVINRDNAYNKVISWLGTEEISDVEFHLDYYSKENGYHIVLIEKR